MQECSAKTDNNITKLSEKITSESGTNETGVGGWEGYLGLESQSHRYKTL